MSEGTAESLNKGVERMSHKPRICNSNFSDQSVGEFDGTWLDFKVLISLEITKAGCEWMRILQNDPL